MCLYDINLVFKNNSPRQSEIIEKKKYVSLVRLKLKIPRTYGTMSCFVLLFYKHVSSIFLVYALISYIKIQNFIYKQCWITCYIDSCETVPHMSKNPTLQKTARDF